MDLLTVADRTRASIWALGEKKFLEWNPDEALPFPAEFVIETVFGVNIVPVPGLIGAIHPAKAFLSDLGRQLTVDADHLNSDEQYRFTVAHEIGHLVLHGEIMRAANYRTAAQYQAFRARLPESTRLKMEQQASQFAGALVAPARHLEDALRYGIATFAEHGVVDPAQVNALWDTVTELAGEYLGLTKYPVEIRSAALGLREKILGLDGRTRRSFG